MNMRRTCPSVLVISLFLLAAPLAQAAVTVGFASPMDKVMIEGARRGWPFEGVIAQQYNLSVARREHEAVQVVIVPDTALTNASVSVSTPTNTLTGVPLAGTVQVSLVGHVNVGDDPHTPAQVPSYLVGYTGWYPDAILTFKQTCSISANDRVAFWVDVAANASAVPGDYTATVTVTATGVSAITRQLNIHVWDIELPFRPRLQTAFSCELTGAKALYGTAFNSTMRYAYYDVLLAHRMSPTELYRTSGPVPQEYIDYWVGHGANAFGLGKSPSVTAASLDPIVAYLRSAGLLDMAYIYGFDEVSTDADFQKIYTRFGEIHTRHPGLRTFTTARDYSFGTSPTTSYLRNVVDIWCVQQPYYSVPGGESLRSEGKELWWYNTAFPAYPWANWLIEYQAIEARLLLGAMAYKYKTDGHLYWTIDKYTNNTSPISSSTGPYTTWDPRSIQHSSGKWVDGDGALVLPGPTGPIPTLRLENIRDGLEDYDLLAMLSDLAGEVRALPATTARQAYLSQADTLLAVPGTVVSSMTSFTRDSASLYAYRQQVADALLAGRPLVSSPDFNSDGSVNSADFDIFVACAGGPGMPYDTAHLPSGCNVSSAGSVIAPDFDQDGDVDTADFACFQRSLTP